MSPGLAWGPSGDEKRGYSSREPQQACGELSRVELEELLFLSDFSHALRQEPSSSAAARPEQRQEERKVINQALSRLEPAPTAITSNRRLDRNKPTRDLNLGARPSRIGANFRQKCPIWPPVAGR